MEIRVENLYKKIGEIKILENINVVFDEGSVNVILGPNGAGKTSLLRQLALLDKPSGGELFFDGEVLTKLSAKTKTNLRRKIGFTFQNPILLSGTVFENIVYGLKVRRLKIDSGKIKEVLSVVSLTEKIGREAKVLSGGEKQRLSLARILVLEPEVYIFDEPTANLDPVSVKTIENVIFQLSQLKKTIILSTHNLRQAKRFGKKLFFMNNGTIAQEGSVKDIFNHPVSVDIAEHIYSENIFRGKIVKKNGQEYLVCGDLKINVVTGDISGDVVGILRPEDIFVSKLPIVSSARNSFNGKIKRIENMGTVYDLTVSVRRVDFETVITKQSMESLDLKPGAEIYLTFKATSVHLVRDDANR
ncbi:MAG: ABC transporter ATP-binding protein [Elusimicrobiota bacterium]|nr:ABC transporter ATP-binding protein [Elusimicrobiota bacterium]